MTSVYLAALTVTLVFYTAVALGICIGFLVFLPLSDKPIPPSTIIRLSLLWPLFPFLLKK